MSPKVAEILLMMEALASSEGDPSEIIRQIAAAAALSNDGRAAFKMLRKGSASFKRLQSAVQDANDPTRPLNKAPEIPPPYFEVEDKRIRAEIYSILGELPNESSSRLETLLREAERKGVCLFPLDPFTRTR